MYENYTEQYNIMLGVLELFVRPVNILSSAGADLRQDAAVIALVMENRIGDAYD